MMKTRSKYLRSAAYALFGPVLAASSSAFQASQEEESRADTDAPALFQENCARCHGETGDGQGWAELDRPARSFEDGGFSYGNTPEALFRTISVGIPGTPMPGFDTSNTEAERRALAEYVITLGPEIREVSESETILEVTDRPLVVRGKLPPIADGTVSHPRGLLLGTTDGFTFEYRADDVRLLGVRLGGFVKRSDWTGRGGTALEPLGKVVHLMEGGKPEPTFTTEAGEPLTAGLDGTWILGGEVGVTYSLQTADGRHVAQVWESCSPVTRTTATGFARHFRVVDQNQLPTIRMPAGGEVADSFFEGDIGWRITRREDGLFEALGVSSLTTYHFVLTAWDEELRAAWLKEKTR